MLNVLIEMFASMNYEQILYHLIEKIFQIIDMNMYQLKNLVYYEKLVLKVLQEKVQVEIDYDLMMFQNLHDLMTK